MWLKLLITLLLVAYLDASCDVCQPGNVACHSENTFSQCVEGKVSGKIVTCPSGYACTGEAGICYPESEGYQPICKSGDSVTDLNTFCTAQGNGAHVNKMDPTCKTYIECYKGRGVLESCQKINKRETYFNGYHCNTVKPEFCN